MYRRIQRGLDASEHLLPLRSAVPVSAMYNCKCNLSLSTKSNSTTKDWERLKLIPYCVLIIRCTRLYVAFPEYLRKLSWFLKCVHVPLGKKFYLKFKIMHVFMSIYFLNIGLIEININTRISTILYLTFLILRAFIYFSWYWS